jgi:hypothetical protein
MARVGQQLSFWEGSGRLISLQLGLVFDLVPIDPRDPLLQIPIEFDDAFRN